MTCTILYYQQIEVEMNLQYHWAGAGTGAAQRESTAGSELPVRAKASKLASAPLPSCVWMQQCNAFISSLRSEVC